MIDIDAKFFDKKRKDFSVIRSNIFRIRYENKDDETFLRSNVSKLIKRFENSNETTIKILERNFHRQRRVTQTAEAIKNTKSQSQTIVRRITNTASIEIQSLKHDIFDFDNENIVDSIFLRVSNFDSENRNQRRQIIFIAESNQQRIFSFIKSTRKSKHIHNDKRFILKFQIETIFNEFAMITTFKFLNHNIDFTSIHVITKNDQFKNNVKQYSEKWFTNIIDFAHDLKNVEVLVNENAAIITQMQSSHQTQKNQFDDVHNQFVAIKTQLRETKEVQHQLTNQKTKTIKMRELRDMHKQRKNALAKKMRALRMNKNSLKKKMLKFKNRKHRHMIDFDNENYNFRNDQRKNRKFLSSFDFATVMSRKANLVSRRNEYQQFSFIDDSRLNNYDFVSKDDFDDVFKHQLVETRFDDDFFLNYRQMFHEKSENIENYYENYVEWKRWKNSLKNKFWINARQFLTKQHKINYCRNHLKSVIYDTVNYRAKLHNSNFYSTFQEMLNDLKKIFEAKNELIKKISEFYNVKFVINKDENFETFLIRFQNLIASLKLSKLILINQMSMKLNERMRFKLRSSKTKIWKEFVKKCRIVQQKMNNLERYKSTKMSTNVTKTSTDFRRQRFKNRSRNKIFIFIAQRQRYKSRPAKRAFYSNFLFRFSKHIRDKIKKKKRCFKCLKKNHKFNDDDVSCKNKKSIDKNDMIATFAQIKIKWNEKKADKYEFEHSECFDCSFQQSQSKN